MKEANLQQWFCRFFKDSGLRDIVSGGAAFELKLVKGNGCLKASAVAEHQIEALIRAKGDKGVPTGRPDWRPFAKFKKEGKNISVETYRHKKTKKIFTVYRNPFTGRFMSSKIAKPIIEKLNEVS